MAGADPELPEAVAAHELDREVRAELRSLSKASADTVSRRLVASGELLNVEPELALRHALAARRIASRIGAVREAVGLAAYQCGQWQLAIAELRAFQRMTGRRTHLAVLADAERGLGRPERAVDMFRHTERKSIAMGEWVELLIVAAGARRDMGQHAAAVTMLQIPALEANGPEPWRARLRYAYADSLAEAGRIEEAYRWFARTIELDPQGDTDAVDRLLALEGVVIEGDDLPDEPEDDEPDTARDTDRTHAGTSAPVDPADRDGGTGARVVSGDGGSGTHGDGDATGPVETAAGAAGGGAVGSGATPADDGDDAVESAATPADDGGIGGGEPVGPGPGGEDGDAGEAPAEDGGSGDATVPEHRTVQAVEFSDGKDAAGPEDAR